MRLILICLHISGNKQGGKHLYCKIEHKLNLDNENIGRERGNISDLLIYV